MLDAKHKSSYIRGMNKLPLETRAQILSMLVEGSSMRSASRTAGVSINTVAKLLVDAGMVCMAFHEATVRNVKAANVQMDEIWSFCYAKKRTVKTLPEDKYIPGAGDVWTFTCLDRDTKLMVNWLAGARDKLTAREFLTDTAAKIATPVQVSTDAWQGYESLISEIFPTGTAYGQVQKVFSETPDRGPARKYSPGVCVCANKTPMFGTPDQAAISTSHVERMNLNIRMGMKRFARLSNAFSKKFENHCHALALYFVFYNFCRVHKSLDGKTPAMAAGLTKTRMTLANIVELIDESERQNRLGNNSN